METGGVKIWTRVQPHGGTQIPKEVRTHLETVEGDILVWTLGDKGEARVRRGEVKEVVTEWPKR